MTYQYLQGDGVYSPPDAFDIWMENEGNAILKDIKTCKKHSCYICGTRNNITEHHIIPLSRGGIDSKYNKVFVCEDHHRKIHSHNKNQPNDKQWILLLFKMKQKYKQEDL